MISRQDNLGSILDSFLRYAVESADADKGILMLERECKLWIEETIVDGVRTTLAGSQISMEKSSGFSKAIVRYVFRTLEKALWNVSDILSVFMADTYAPKSGAKAIVCLPILFRGIPAGVLYLENNRDESAFTGVRMGQLELLSEQLVTVKKLQAYLEGTADEEIRSDRTLAEPLTSRETQVLRLIASGMSNKEIADTLALTVNTVKGYVKNIYGKMGVNRRVQVAAKAKDMDIMKIG
jgi:DNA-binding CsgD family transcriptional regulator